jgi:hypothetical protein
VTAAPSSRFLSSSPSNPCPICGRSADGDCRYSDDGPKWLCHHGSSFSPPSGLKIGEVVVGQDFRDWAYCGETKDKGPSGQGRCSIFKLHEEKRPALRLVEAPKPAFSLARLSPEAKPAKGIATAGRQHLLRLLRRAAGTAQTERPWHQELLQSPPLNRLQQGPRRGPLACSTTNQAAIGRFSGWVLEVEGREVLLTSPAASA